MNQKIALVSLLVKDYDEAINFYVIKLGFDLVEDTLLSEDKRWVIVSPKGKSETGILLAKASNAKQIDSIGNQSGGRVFLFLHTDDISGDYERMLKMDVKFIRPPLKESYGTVAVFEDLYGNKWDLIEPAV